MRDTMIIRPMRESDLPDAVALSAVFGWPHRLEDWRLMFEVGAGFVVMDGHDRLVGSAMWWPYGEATATLGMVIVSPACQGQGFGRRLMLGVLGAAGGRSLRLVATKAGAPLYRSMGFQDRAALEQRQGEATPDHGADDPAIRAARPGDLARLVEVDSQGFGGDRAGLLGGLRDRGDVAVLERNGAIGGYSICRAFGRGHLVGPVVCADAHDAIALMRPHVRAHAGRFLRVDTTFTEGPFADYLTSVGLAVVDRSVQMDRGASRPSGPVRVYTLASQALG